MALPDGEAAMVAAIKQELDNQFKGKPPPTSQDEGLQRIADAVGKAVVDALNSHLEIDVPSITDLPFNGGAATFKWNQ